MHVFINHRVHVAVYNIVMFYMKWFCLFFQFFKAVEHDSTLDNTPSLSLQSLTEEEKVWLLIFNTEFSRMVILFWIVLIHMMPSLKSLQFIYRKHYDSKIVQFQRHLHKSFCRAIILSLADTLSFFLFLDTEWISIYKRWRTSRTAATACFIEKDVRTTTAGTEPKNK